MKMEERDRLIKEDGRKELLLELVSKKLEKGKSIKEIAGALEEQEDMIKALIQELES